MNNRASPHPAATFVVALRRGLLRLIVTLLAISSMNSFPVFCSQKIHNAFSLGIRISCLASNGYAISPSRIKYPNIGPLAAKVSPLHHHPLLLHYHSQSSAISRQLLQDPLAVVILIRTSFMLYHWCSMRCFSRSSNQLAKTVDSSTRIHHISYPLYSVSFSITSSLIHSQPYSAWGSVVDSISRFDMYQSLLPLPKRIILTIFHVIVHVMMAPSQFIIHEMQRVFSLFSSVATTISTRKLSAFEIIPEEHWSCPQAAKQIDTSSSFVVDNPTTKTLNHSTRLSPTSTITTRATTTIDNNDGDINSSLDVDFSNKRTVNGGTDDYVAIKNAKQNSSFRISDFSAKAAHQTSLYDERNMMLPPVTLRCNYLYSYRYSDAGYGNGIANDRSITCKDFDSVIFPSSSFQISTSSRLGNIALLDTQFKPLARNSKANSLSMTLPPSTVSKSCFKRIRSTLRKRGQ